MAHRVAPALQQTATLAFPLTLASLTFKCRRCCFHTDVRLIPNAAFLCACRCVGRVYFRVICLCSTAPPDGPLALAEARGASACSAEPCARVFKVVLLFVGESPLSCRNSFYQEAPTHVASRRNTTRHDTKKANKTNKIHPSIHFQPQTLVEPGQNPAGSNPHLLAVRRQRSPAAPPRQNKIQTIKKTINHYRRTRVTETSCKQSLR